MSCKRSSSSSSSSSAAIIEGNDDLLIEILLFMPARSAVRVKLVSRRWRSIISSPSFCRLHSVHHPHRRPQTEHSFILCDANLRFFICHPTVRRLIPFSFGVPFVAILQSCNGLLLLRCSNTEYGRTRYCIFNPATMQSRDLPRLPCLGYIEGHSLMFDPSVSQHYRVVCFLRLKNAISYQVYDSETREWNLGGELKNKISFRSGIYYRGGVYFIRVRTSSSRFTPEGDLSTVPSPPRHQRGNYVMESNGALLAIFFGKDSKVLHVHETKEIDKGWTKIYRIDLNPVLASFGENRDTAMSLLGLIRGEKEEDSLLLLRLPGKIVIYCICDAVSEVLVDFGTKGCLEFGFKNTHQFIESLAPV